MIFSEGFIKILHMIFFLSKKKTRKYDFYKFDIHNDNILNQIYT